MEGENTKLLLILISTLPHPTRRKKMHAFSRAATSSLGGPCESSGVRCGARLAQLQCCPAVGFGPCAVVAAPGSRARVALIVAPDHRVEMAGKALY
jgi:hypothetical protein